MKRNNLIKVLCLGIVSFNIGCTNLDEEILDGVPNDTSSGGSINTASTLQSAYEGLRDFNGQGMMFALDEMSTDALVGPTRGGDWDDNGAWRQIHTQTWAPDHVEVRGAWNSLLSNVYKCNLVIENGGTASEVVQARFLRAFYYYNVVDLFGQAPYRPEGSDLLSDPLVWSRSEATDFIISELEAILSSLPARVSNDASFVNADAGHFLLAKIYLNKGVFKATSPEGPYTFDAADMNKVVDHVDALTTSLSSEYWNNFAPDNNNSNEIIFSSKNVLGGPGGNMQSKWRMGTHYNQTPSGWNGFATVAEYYNKFDATDVRAKYSNSQILFELGNPVGFQVGQVKNGRNRDERGRANDDNNVPYTNIPAGTLNLQDRNGNPLIYTASLTLITSGATLETAGIRGLKYIPDTGNLDSPNNDLVLMRHSDALLMKAEAIARGASGDASSIMSEIAARVGLSPAAASLDGIYDERGRELWWEGWRRNDMIRFGKFLDARELKPYASNPKYLLYPIPADALFNANLTQNPGY